MFHMARPQLPPPPRGPPEGPRGVATLEDEDEEPGDPEEEEETEEEEEEPDPEAPENGSVPRFVPRFNFTLKDLTRFVDFNIKGRDVIVFLHIQKTGGTTFGRHLVKNIRLEQPCSCKAGQKKCTCHRPGKKETWLFSRFSTGWSCGLHADWTELTNCVPAIMEKKDCPRNHSHTSTSFHAMTNISNDLDIIFRPLSLYEEFLAMIKLPSELFSVGYESY
ncbi:Heparan-sulfate 6-O-sulfotransferase 3 [Tupaia chinensis]|uniref:Heparan-sulfate 6-O-sulfotransferase n=1 Tax=Tupaia chinensis TaxID=246437 RepID=L9LA53_TUPCH|nr:Heparan-sulfate 6-O-sulfotransferase 3 [Tupaia chinensis]